MIKAYISSEAVVVPPPPMLFWLKYMFRMLGVCVKRYSTVYSGNDLASMGRFTKGTEHPERLSRSRIADNLCELTLGSVPSLCSPIRIAQWLRVSVCDIFW